MKKIVFLSTGNACRGIIAEAIVNHLGADKFQAFSAGSFPTGQIHPMTTATLKLYGIETSGYRSKSWNEFTSHPVDFVIYVCDQAAGELCPVFLGNPVRSHWGLPNALQVSGPQGLQKISFDEIYEILETRIRALLRLPLDQMSREETIQRLHDIGNLKIPAARPSSSFSEEMMQIS